MESGSQSEEEQFWSSRVTGTSSAKWVEWILQCVSTLLNTFYPVCGLLAQAHQFLLPHRQTEWFDLVLSQSLYMCGNCEIYFLIISWHRMTHLCCFQTSLLSTLPVQVLIAGGFLFVTAFCFWSWKQHTTDLLTQTKSSSTFLVERMASVRHRQQDRRTM